MIQRISSLNGYTPSFNKKAVSSNQEAKKQPTYMDSFVKHAKQSSPFLLGMTVFWTIIDKTTKQVPFKKSVVNNLTSFFAPVLICSSAILAGIEHRQSYDINNQK